MKKQEEERKRKEEEERIKKEEEVKKAAAKAEEKKEKKEDKTKDEKKEKIEGASKTTASICPKVNCTCIDTILKPVEKGMDKVFGTSMDPFTGYKHIINKVLEIYFQYKHTKFSSCYPLCSCSV